MVASDSGLGLQSAADPQLQQLPQDGMGSVSSAGFPSATTMDLFSLNVGGGEPTVVVGALLPSQLAAASNAGMQMPMAGLAALSAGPAARMASNMRVAVSSGDGGGGNSASSPQMLTTAAAMLNRGPGGRGIGFGPSSNGVRQEEAAAAYAAAARALQRAGSATASGSFADDAATRQSSGSSTATHDATSSTGPVASGGHPGSPTMDEVMTRHLQQLEQAQQAHLQQAQRLQEMQAQLKSSLNLGGSGSGSGSGRGSASSIPAPPAVSAAMAVTMAMPINPHSVGSLPSNFWPMQMLDTTRALDSGPPGLPTAANLPPP